MISDMPTQEFQSWWKHLKQTGDICPVRLGMSRAQLRGILGEPDDTGGTSRRDRTPRIWKYDQVEFHFGLPDSLTLIYLEVDEIVRLSIGMLVGGS
jgi:hypothetical protein